MMRYMLILGALEMGALAVAAQAEPLAVITDGAAAECFQYAPAFSFDGARLAWVETREPNGDCYIQVMEIATRKTRRVPEQGRAEAFCWWPEGDVLAYVNSERPGRDEPAKLCTFDLDLGTGSEVPLGVAAAHHLVWTRDGIELILVEADPDQMPTAWYIGRVLPEQSQVEFLTGPMDVDLLYMLRTDSAFAWSPEAKTAAVLVWPPRQRPSLHVWEVGLPGFAPDDRFGRLDLVLGEPPCMALGPEGKGFFFAGFRRGERLSGAIWRYDPGKGEARPILHLEGDTESPLCLGMSPSADRVALISVEPGGVAVRLRVARLNEDVGWTTRRIDIERDFAWPGGRPRRPLSISWSRDGESVAYSIGGEVRLAAVGSATWACTCNLKQVALAFLMFASDWDEALPGPMQVTELKQLSPTFKPVEGPDWWTALIYPYVWDESLMRCPLMGEGEGSGYVYPEHLWGKNVGDIENPSKTILLMDSEPRHDGKRVVAFADGHAKACAEEEVQRLLGEQ